jgi:hypothetical protein
MEVRDRPEGVKQHLVIAKFHMETPELIRLMMRPGDWAVSVDLSDAYFHVAVTRRFHRYLMFKH